MKSIKIIFQIKNPKYDKEGILYGAEKMRHWCESRCMSFNLTSSTFGSFMVEGYTLPYCRGAAGEFMHLFGKFQNVEIYQQDVNK